jgi:hypothetical protein
MGLFRPVAGQLYFTLHGEGFNNSKTEAGQKKNPDLARKNPLSWLKKV